MGVVPEGAGCRDVCVVVDGQSSLCVQNVGQTECAASEETEQTDGETVAPPAAPSSSTESQVTSMVHTAGCAGQTQL